MPKEIKARRVNDFLDLEKPGDFFWTKNNRMMFLCPCGCGSHPAVVVKPDYPNGWDFDGNFDCPTISPSIDINKGHWHGYLTNGVFRSCD